MSSASGGVKKKKAANVKKKNQEEWDEVVKYVRGVSREQGLPIGPETNFVLKLIEECAEDNKPFPPKQIIIGKRPMDNPVWVKILAQTLISKPVTAYKTLFLTKSYKGLKAICFWGVDVGDVGCKYLCEALPLLEYCCKLELMDCGIGVAATEHLAAYLKHRRTTHLKILRLDHNAGIGSQGLARLSEGLYFNSLLHTLSLAYCNISKEGGTFIQNILMTKGIGIKTLNLEGNQLERTGIMALSQGLTYNKVLTSLNLTCNNFGGDGSRIPGESEAVKYLATGISNCKTLKTIHMDGNLIGDEGIAILLQFANTLVNDVSLFKHVTELNFTPFLESESYKALVDKIEANKPVKKKKKKKSTKKKKKK